MDLLNLVHHAPVTVSPEDTVSHAIEISMPARVGAVAVMEADRLVGIFTERDVMLKVVHRGLDARTTVIKSVMTPNPLTVTPNQTPQEVLQLMLARHIRHMPIVRPSGELVGLLSIRNVLQFMVEHLNQDLQHIADYAGITHRP